MLTSQKILRNNKKSQLDNNKILEKRAEGLQNASSKTFTTMGIGPLDEIDKIEFHLNHDSVCTLQDTYLGNTVNGKIVCDYLYDWIQKGGVLNASNCIDLSYPKSCINPSQYHNSKSIEANGIEMHELHHIVLRSHMTTNLQELFALPIGVALSNDSGFTEINSFGDLPRVTWMSVWDYGLLNDLYTSYGFDIQDIKLFFSKLRETYYSGNYKPTLPIPNGKIKCDLDTAVREATGIQADTYDIFVGNVCNNLMHIIPCNLTNPANSSSYINRGYCGK